MKDLLARIIAYVFVGSFCIAGPLCLVIALDSAVQRAALVHWGLRAQGTVIAKRQTGAAPRVTYAPVFQFTASDGRRFVVSSDVYGRESEFQYGEQVRVLYRKDHPESARIDAFAQLWTLPLIVGAVGTGFSMIPALLLANRMRRRRRPGEPADPATAHDETGTASPGLRWTLGLLLTAGGILLLGAGLENFSPDSSALHGSRVIVTAMGVLLISCGVLIAQWVATGSRLYRALGAAAFTSMAVMFGWVALYGDAAGFRSGVGAGGVALTSGGSVLFARIAFGAGSILLGLGAVWAWTQVLHAREAEPR